MIGPLEIIVLAIIVILIVGRNRLPEAGRSLGGGIRNFIDGVRNADDGEDDKKPEAISERSESDREHPPAD